LPSSAASLTQKTCSKKCRLSRRGKQAKGRRAAALPAAREDERERQHRHREREGAAGAPMSRTGLSAQAAEAIEEIIKKLGQAQRLSRTGLRRQLRRLSLGESASAGLETGT